MKPMCQKAIELGSDIVTYCMLPVDHDGRCEPAKADNSDHRALLQWWKKNGEKEA